MNKIIKKIILLLIFTIYSVNIYSQDNSNCVYSYTSGSVTPYKPTKTPNVDEYLNCLIIYVTFPDDNNPPSYDNFWPAHSQPVSPNGSTGLLATSEGNPSSPFMNRYPEYTISDYFCEMSMGQLDIIGDEVHIEMPQTSYWYRANQYSQGPLNRVVIQLANQQYPNLNFADYDRWEFNSTTQRWEQNSDGVVDMIIVAYRYIPSITSDSLWFFCGYSASGEASLGWCGGFTPLVIDGKTINGGFGHTSGSGCTAIGQRLKYSGVTHVIEHEIGHSFYINNLHGSNHTSNGLMVGVEAAAYNMSPYERSRSILGWNINPTSVTSTSTHVLEDYISSGDMLRIPIPGSSTEAFWISNHQKVSRYDGVSRGGKECWDINFARQDPYCPYGKGLFMYHESPGCTYNFSKPIDLEQADGRWNWNLDRWYLIIFHKKISVYRYLNIKLTEVIPFTVKQNTCKRYYMLLLIAAGQLIGHRK